jgi:hypothetical protein
MSKAQKPWHTSISTSNAATNPDRIAPKNVGNPRTKATIKRYAKPSSTGVLFHVMKEPPAGDLRSYKSPSQSSHH